MNELGISLVLLSATLHAAWNLFSKSSGDPLSFLISALMHTTIIYFPLFVFMQFHVSYPPRLLAYVAASGICVGLYFLSLGKAYHHGKISIAYPVARSFPILVVVWVGMFMGKFPSFVGFCGILLVVSGCFILPWSRFSFGPDGFRLANYKTRSVVWALSAAVFTAAYSVIDKYAAREMGNSMGWGLLEKVNYVYLQNAISWGTVLLLTKATGYEIAKAPKKQTVFCGAVFLISYSLIVVALASNPVAYVVSFRQIGVVFATVVSMLWMERSFSWPRLVGVCAIFAGIVCVAAA